MILLIVIVVVSLLILLLWVVRRLIGVVVIVVVVIVVGIVVSGGGGGTIWTAIGAIVPVVVRTRWPRWTAIVVEVVVWSTKTHVIIVVMRTHVVWPHITIKIVV